MENQKVVLITGCSSGINMATASYPVGTGAKKLFILKSVLSNSFFEWIVRKMFFG